MTYYDATYALLSYLSKEAVKRSTSFEFDRYHWEFFRVEYADGIFTFDYKCGGEGKPYRRLVQALIAKREVQLPSGITEMDERSYVLVVFHALKLRYTIHRYKLMGTEDFQEMEARKRQRRKRLNEKACMQIDVNLAEELGLTPVFDPRHWSQHIMTLEGSTLIIGNASGTWRTWRPSPSPDCIFVQQKILPDGSKVFKLIVVHDNQSFTEPRLIREVALLGRDKTDQLWLLHVPPNYAYYSIDTCLRWVLNMHKEDVLVAEA